MTQKATMFRNMSQGYKNAVVEALTKKIGMPEAVKLFGRYYEPVKKVWGHEPNAEEFANQILRLNDLIRNRPAPGQGFSIRLKPHFRVNPITKKKVFVSGHYRKHTQVAHRVK